MFSFVYQSLAAKKKKKKKCCGNQKVRLFRESFPMTSEIGVEMESPYSTKAGCQTLRNHSAYNEIT